MDSSKHLAKRLPPTAPSDKVNHSVWFNAKSTNGFGEENCFNNLQILLTDCVVPDQFLSNNSTLVRAIFGNFQSKEIIGIVSDIRSISSGFLSVSFSHFSRSENSKSVA
ncbi:hypothetical protein F2Q68_00040976 [Brassica cretica]|uniref:Uncharacterized protein n=1 Tax=Brassica cretica TaxID=69181 RepID=A0A8S9MTE7_BRACR|nr:hypothetical protein F2Q68_00040976 [Brassica cretica]